MNRIDQRFKKLRKAYKKAFIAFITAGYPSLNLTEKLILELDRRGVDVIEIGVPFTDPMADGPVIQEASQVALRNKVKLTDILKLVKRVRRYTNIPICLMTYYNPVFCFGESKFVKQAQSAGVDGLIIPDLPPEEAHSLTKKADKYGIDMIFFLSPTSTKERIKFISKRSKGFIYYVSLTGVTGTRCDLPVDLAKHLKEIKRHTKKPLCVGFGISSNKQVKLIRQFADGVIIGSAIITKIKENLTNPNLVKVVGEFVSRLND